MIDPVMACSRFSYQCPTSSSTACTSAAGTAAGDEAPTVYSTTTASSRSKPRICLPNSGKASRLLMNFLLLRDGYRVAAIDLDARQATLANALAVLADVTPEMVDRFEFEMDTSKPIEVWKQEVADNLARKAAAGAPQ